MNAIEIEETAKSDLDEQFGDPLDQPDPHLHLPGTPTVSFVEYVELAIAMLIRR